MGPCNDLGDCSTGTDGDGDCACEGTTGVACESDDECDDFHFGGPMHAFGNEDLVVPSFFSADQAMGPVSDFEVLRPGHLSSITFWGRAGLSNDSSEIYRPRLPSAILVTLALNDPDSNTTGPMLVQRNITDPQFITMIAGPQLLSTLTRVTVSFDKNDDINRYTLWPGRYWLQVLVQDAVVWDVWMTTARQLGNFPDVFYNALTMPEDPRSWPRTTTIPGVVGQQYAELVFVLEFDHCLPSYQYGGVPLPRPEVTTPDFMDFFPKRAIERETLNLTFTGYVLNGCGRQALVKIADRNVGYGCIGEALGGEARPLTPDHIVQFTVSTPGVYSVCIKTDFDVDWEEIGREALVVYPFAPTENFYGFSTCEALIQHNATVCGCTYEQPGPGVIATELPINFPYVYMTSGTTPTLVRQGCCTPMSTNMRRFPFVNGTNAPTGRFWGVCLLDAPAMI